MAPEDLNDPTPIIERRENGIGAVREKPTQKAISKFKLLFKCIEKEPQWKADQSVACQSSHATIGLHNSFLKPNPVIVQRSLNISWPLLFNGLWEDEVSS